MKRLLTVALLLTFAASSSAAEKDRLDPLAYLVGGSWIGSGKWPDGSQMLVEQRYLWGATKKVIHFETVDVTGKERKLLYEGMLFHDSKRDKLVQWNFKPDGSFSETVMTDFTDAGFEARGSNTWSIIRRVSPNEFEWELRVPKEKEWPSILKATYLRKPADEGDAHNAMRGFLDALNALDAPAMMSYFADDATAFFPLARRDRTDGKDAIAAVFNEYAAQTRKQVSKTNIVPEDLRVDVHDDVAVASFNVRNEQAVARRTFILQRRSDRWLIIHMHASNFKLQ